MSRPEGTSRDSGISTNAGGVPRREKQSVSVTYYALIWSKYQHPMLCSHPFFFQAGSAYNAVAWPIFILLQFFVLPFLSLQVYYNGHISFSKPWNWTTFSEDRSLFLVSALTAGKVAVNSFRNVIWADIRQGNWKPLYAHRLVMLLAGNLISFTVYDFWVISSSQWRIRGLFLCFSSLALAIASGLNIQSYLFSFMLINCAAYLVYYIVCKVWNGI